MPQAAVRSISHYKVRSIIGHSKIQHTHDIRVLQASDYTSFKAKTLQILRSQPRMKDFNRSFGTEVGMFAQIYLGMTSLPQDARQSITTKLLAGSDILHHVLPLNALTPIIEAGATRYLLRPAALS